MERLHAGWLIKSPPEKKTQGPWKLFKSKWRQRYFVLYAPPSVQSIPGCCSALLCYYDDENMIRERGRIDLNNCEEILTQLESDQHHNVFALRIINKGHERTYYLAADSEQEMNKWSDCLCCVLRMSSGEGIALSSGFGHQSPTNGLFNTNLPRCSILTQKTGEQRRLSNVPDTISKSANALNIRVAEANQNSASNNTTTAPSRKRISKRQSILQWVVKPAVDTLRRPSFPALNTSVAAAAGGVHNKSQASTPLVKQSNSQPSFCPQSSESSDFSNFSSLTLERPIPRFQLEPPTPGLGRGSSPLGHDQELDERRRFTNDNSHQPQYPPTLPARINRSPSNVQQREKVQVQGLCNRNSAGNPRSIWRDSDFVDDDIEDEDNRDPDYDLPRLCYDPEVVNTCTSDFSNQTKTDENAEDDDDYSYPHFHYPTEPEFAFQSSLSVVQEAEGTNPEDSYDYLPGCSSSSRKSSKRTSDAPLSNGDNQSYDDHGIYDVLPKRESAEPDENTSCNRISDLEMTSNGTISPYQNDVFCPSMQGVYTSPVLLVTEFTGSILPPCIKAETTADNGSRIEYANTVVLPPLPQKKACAQNRENTAEKKKMVTPFPSSPGHSSLLPSNDVHCYVNAQAHRRSKGSANSSQDEGVYLPMTGSGSGEGGEGGARSKADDALYTPMHSPSINILSPTSSEKRNSSENGADYAGDELLTSHSETNVPPGAGEPCVQSLSLIRFTPNTRSFKRRTQNSDKLDIKNSPECSGKLKENREPSFSLKLPPPLPPKNSVSKSSTYIHYAALNLDSDNIERKLPSPHSSISTPPSEGPPQSDTLYRLIDAEKTKALCDLRKQLDNRQRNFGNLSPEK